LVAIVPRGNLRLAIAKGTWRGLLVAMVPRGRLVVAIVLRGRLLVAIVQRGSLLVAMVPRGRLVVAIVPRGSLLVAVVPRGSLSAIFRRGSRILASVGGYSLPEATELWDDLHHPIRYTES